MSTTLAMYQAGDQPVPGYTLVEPLGKGSFGQVWKATSPGETEVAIKIVTGLDQEGARREFESLRDAKRFNHPNLTKIFAFWVKDEKGEILAEDAVRQMAPAAPPVPVTRVAPPLSLRDTLQASPMETDRELPDPERPQFIDPIDRKHPAQLIIAMGLGDKTLADRLHECRVGKAPEEPGGIPVDELLRYMDAAARALHYLNVDMKVQHCDIKPQNVLLVGGEAQVCDFSVVKQVSEVLRQTTTGGFSEPYAPPEAFNREFSNRFDQYSLAVTYAELRTGCLPFECDTRASMYRAKFLGELDLSHLSPAEQQVIAKAMSVNPSDRYESVVQLVRALHDAVHPPLRFHGKPRRRAWDFAVLGGLLLTAAVVIGILVWRSQQAQVATFKDLMSHQRFSAAADLLDRFSKKASEPLRAELIDVWRKAVLARLDTPAEMQSAFNDLDELLELTGNDETISAAARGAIERDLRVADAQLSAVNWTSTRSDEAAAALNDIRQHLAAVQTKLGWDDLAAWHAVSIQRLYARREKVKWKNIRSGLNGIKAQSLPPAPEVRLPYFTLLAVAEVEENRNDLLNNLELRVACAEASRAQAKLSNQPETRQRLAWEEEKWNSIREQLYRELVQRIRDGQLDPSLQQAWEEAIGDRFRIGLRIVQAKLALESHQLDDVRTHLAEMKQNSGASGPAAKEVLIVEVRLALDDPQGAWSEAAERLLAEFPQLERRQVAEVGQHLLGRLTRELPGVDLTLLDRLSEAWKSAERDASPELQPTLVHQVRELEALAALRDPTAARLSALSVSSESEAQLTPSLLRRLVLFEKELVSAELGSEAARQHSQTIRELREAKRTSDEPEYLAGYGDYLIAWADRNDAFRLADSATRLAAAVAQHGWLFRAERAERTRDVLISAALQRLPTDRAFLVQEELGVDEQVASWVTSAAHLPLEPEFNLMVAQILAGSFVSEAARLERTQRIDLGAALLGEATQVEALRTQERLDMVRLATARALAERGQETVGNASAEDLRLAIQHFAAILASRFRWEDEEIPGVAEEQLERWVIEPALAAAAVVLGDAADRTSEPAAESGGGPASQLGQLGVEVASLYGARARLLERSPSSKAAENIRARAEAFHAANRYHATARYKTGEGRAIYDDWQRPKQQKADELRKLAEEALELSNQQSGEAWALLGEAHHTAALLLCSADQQQVDAVFRSAKQAYDKALTTESVAAFPTRRARWLVFRSAIFVELAHLEPKRERKKELLEDAVRDAEASLGDPHLRMPEEPLNAMGNAKEDLAWKVYRTSSDAALSRQYYTEAIDAFDRAIVKAQHTPELAKTLMNGGRCRFRFAASLRARNANNAEAAGLLKEARRLLEEARAEAALNDPSQSGSLRAQIAWLISEVLRYVPPGAAPPEGIIDPYTKPDSALRDAIAIAQEVNSEHWLTYQKTWAKAAIRDQRYGEFVDRATPIITEAGKQECNPLTLTDLWDLVAIARFLPGREPLDWVESIASHFPENPRDARYGHRVLLEVYRRYYRAILLTPDPNRLEQARTDVGDLLETIERMPDSGDREILALVGGAAYAVCNAQSVASGADPTVVRTRLLETCAQLDALADKLDSELSIEFVDASMDSEIRKRLGTYTRILLRTFSGTAAERLPANLRLSDAQTTALKTKAARALKPMLTSASLSDDEKIEIQTLIDALR